MKKRPLRELKYRFVDASIWISNIYEAGYNLFKEKNRNIWVEIIIWHTIFLPITLSCILLVFIFNIFTPSITHNSIKIKEILEEIEKNKKKIKQNKYKIEKINNFFLEVEDNSFLDKSEFEGTTNFMNL